MKRINHIIAAIALSAATYITAGAADNNTAEGKERGYMTINRQTAEAHIGFLASDELQGREAGYPSGRIAANYAEACLRATGLEPWDGKTYRQPFAAYRRERQKKGRYTVHPDSIARLEQEVHQKLPLTNIMGRITGKNPDEYVIIGAHFDHLGVDPLLDGDKIYNGADDNASGVAAVLQIARAFVESGVQPERTVIFALWDGEEKGLLGSEHFMLQWPEPSKIKGYLNFDMIGRNNDESNPEHVVYFYTEAHPAFEQWLRNDITERGLRLKPNYRPWDRPIGGGDNGSFAKRDVPVIWYHTDGHPDYHMPSDHTDRINWDKTVDITRAAYLNLWNLANMPAY
ncbi:M20/M25/M40 family metallo-hydrolase [Paramuribaculum intestinale]|uniref:M20/M25/M40 family metallo-hydrolase n=1 Tax=Paramuribaculum intestinale TaxID=2094151 RepID=UPI0025B05ABF|nr:M20/M25/M40 family metallo-hydrolase [Paramuribaculum intestinale]